MNRALCHVADVGNTSTKIGTFSLPGLTPMSTQTLIRGADSPETLDSRLGSYLENFPGSVPWYVASVCHAASEKLTTWIEKRCGAPVRCLRNQDCPIAVDVDRPERVGIDRLLGAVAANLIRPVNQSAIVVDAGTAITVDLISPDGVFHGGAILPGSELQARSLANATDRLPLVELDRSDETTPSAVGKSTEAAIQSGLFWGTIGAVGRIVDEMQKQFGPAALLATGGGMRPIARHLNARFEPDLVLTGIAFTVQHLLEAKE